jgi:C-terminal processing protease CtpA/Prc
MKKIYLIFLVFILVQNTFGQVSQKFSAEQVKQDLKYLYSTLEESHYNLYVHTPKEKFDKKYNRIYNSIKDSVNILQVYRLFQPFVALSKIGHCWCDNSLVGDVYDAYIGSGGTVFPINITVNDNKMIVNDDYSNSKRIQIGDEIVTINGKSAKSILDNIYSFLSGENDYWINTRIDLFTFPRLNWVMNAPCDSYSIQIKNQQNELINLNLPAISAGKFEEIQSNKKQIFNSGRKFKFIDDIAYMQPGQFSNAYGDNNSSNIKTFEKGEFLAYIDSAFREIQKRGSKNLIIDLRDNPGGSSTFSDEMVAYIADKPFKFCSRFSVKTSKITKEYWKQVNDTSLKYLKTKILNTPEGETFDVAIPEHDFRKDSLKFRGKVYVLINRYSYSQTADVATQVQDYKFGLLIGEKTAQIPTNYGSTHQFVLPNTKMAVEYPKAFIVRPNGNTNFEGVTPDILVKDNISNENDVILDYTLNLIKKENKK